MTQQISVDEKTAMAAAEWFFKLQEPSATDRDKEIFTAWRQADPRHETAWQRAQLVSDRLSAVPEGLVSVTLQRAQAISGRRSAIKTLSVLMLAGSAGWQAWQSEPARLYFAQYSTRRGEHQQVILADGSQVFLNTASGINTRIDTTQRLIRLEVGEILIQTGHAGALARQPLQVATRNGILRPLGTRFIVRQQQDAIALSVLEGMVEITTLAGKRQILQAGWQTTFTSEHIQQQTAVDAHADSWTRGILHARDMRLKDFVSELERYRPGFLRCEPDVADLRISGVFQLNNADQVIESLPQVLPVTVTYLTRYWVTLAAANPEI